MMKKMVTPVTNTATKTQFTGARVIGRFELAMVRIKVFRQLFNLVKTHERDC